jgi:hypothetical protein
MTIETERCKQEKKYQQSNRKLIKNNKNAYHNFQHLKKKDVIGKHHACSKLSKDVIGKH